MNRMNDLTPFVQPPQKIPVIIEKKPDEDKNVVGLDVIENQDEISDLLPGSPTK